MAIERENLVKNPEVFAQDAETYIPATPTPGIAYRDESVTPEIIKTGQQYNSIYNSAIYNQVFYMFTSLAKTWAEYGCMPYIEGQAYKQWARALWTNGSIYHCTKEIPAEGLDGMSAGYYTGGVIDWVSISDTVKGMTAAGFKISVDGAAEVEVGPFTCAAATDPASLCGIINTALTGKQIQAVFTYDSEKNTFVVTSKKMGSGSAVAALTPATTETITNQLAATLKLDAAGGGSATAGGTGKAYPKPEDSSGVWVNDSSFQTYDIPRGAVMPFHRVQIQNRQPIFWGQTAPDVRWLICDGGSDNEGGTVPDLKEAFIMGSSQANLSADTHGYIMGGYFINHYNLEQMLEKLKLITNDTFGVVVDNRASVTVGPIDCSGITDVNSVITLLQSKLDAANAGCDIHYHYEVNRFSLVSRTAGGNSCVQPVTTSEHSINKVGSLLGLNSPALPAVHTGYHNQGTGGYTGITPKITVANSTQNTTLAASGNTAQGTSGTTLSVAQLANHLHSAPALYGSAPPRGAETDGTGKEDNRMLTSKTGSNATHAHTVNINHNHTVTNPAHGHTATSTNVNTIPPFYRLVYCVKVK